MTNAEIRMTNEARMSNDERSAMSGGGTTIEPPPPGQFSLQTLFWVSLFVAVACAIVMPIVRGWPHEFQLRFALTLTIYFGIVGLCSILIIRSQRVARRKSGTLLFFVKHGSPRGERVSFFTFNGFIWIAWFFQMHLMATDGELRTVNFFTLHIVFHAANLTIFIFAGMRGIQFREHAIVSGMARIKWSDISRYSWGPGSTLVIFIKSVRAAVQLGSVPPDQRAAVEALLDEQLARARCDERNRS
jgi:hypothetical protein